MCRLFGFRSAVTSNAHRSLVVAHNAVATQARAHTDGWGIGFFKAGEPRVFHSVNPAARCQAFRRTSEYVSSQTFVVHVRRATVGRVSPRNLHPFQHGRWLFAHNGTIFGFEQLRPRMLETIPGHLRLYQLGTTDTEVLFHYLLAALHRAGLDPRGTSSVDPQGLALTLQDAVRTLHQWALEGQHPAPIVNFLLTNNRVFVANRRGRELFLATQKRFCRDEATCQEVSKVCLIARRPKDRVNHLIVASERIGDEDHWEELPEGGMAVLTEDFHLKLPPPLTLPEALA